MLTRHICVVKLDILYIDLQALINPSLTLHIPIRSSLCSPLIFFNNPNLLTMTDAFAFSYPSPLAGYENLEPLPE